MFHVWILTSPQVEECRRAFTISEAACAEKSAVLLTTVCTYLLVHCKEAMKDMTKHETK